MVHGWNHFSPIFINGRNWCDFDVLWKELWGEQIGIQYRGEEKTSREKFNSLEDLQIHRGKQNISSLSMGQSRQYLRRRQNQENKINTERAFNLISQDEKIRQAQDKIWSKLRLLSDK